MKEIGEPQGGLWQLDDTVTLLIPDGLDRLQTVAFGDICALKHYLSTVKKIVLEISCVAADCRSNLIPCSFMGFYVGTTEPSGDFADLGEALEFQPLNDEESIALPFGWLTSIRVELESTQRVA